MQKRINKVQLNDAKLNQCSFNNGSSIQHQSLDQARLMIWLTLVKSPRRQLNARSIQHSLNNCRSTRQPLGRSITADQNSVIKSNQINSTRRQLSDLLNIARSNQCRQRNRSWSDFAGQIISRRQLNTRSLVDQSTVAIRRWRCSQYSGHGVNDDNYGHYRPFVIFTTLQASAACSAAQHAIWLIIDAQ